ncbi:hypothetical protein AB0I16_04055 [Streptomyces sp. NPDC050703]|uniref:hypothetical protein n=1 Tax=Streptomyces sp. NPDC050703 TaxID=3157218 RepID=UPI00342DC0A0
MGIESDQLVYDYLSRVGDLAQQRQLPSGARMRLVSELRDQIDRGRSKAVVESPAAIRRILARLGTPEEIVEAAGGATGGAAAPPGPAAVPTQRTARPRPRKRAERPGKAERPPEPAEPPGDTAGPYAAPPHLAGTDELGPSGSEPDWWRHDDSPFGVADSVPGFVGGVEVPELLRPPPAADDAPGVPHPRLAKAPGAPAEAALDEEATEEAVEAGGRRGRRLRLRPAAGGFSNPLLVAAAVLLVVGAVIGNWLALGVGWLIAYASRRLSRAEVKAAVIGIPVLAVTAGLTWLWGRSERGWGGRIRDGHMSDAVAETWPWVVRGAAIASALFLLWRSQRRRP